MSYAVTVEAMRGFTLLETLMTTGILAVGLVGVAAIFSYSARANLNTRHRTTATMLLYDKMEQFKSTPLADSLWAGDGVPVYASRFDSLAQEGAAVVLASSTNNRIDFRAGLSLVETSVTTPVPLECTLGLSRTLTVADGSSFLNALGTTTPTGKFV